MLPLSNCILMMDEGIGRVRDVFAEMPATESALARLLLMVGTRLQEEQAHLLKPHKLNDSDFLTLMILFSRPDGSSTPGELCEFTSQGPTNMTRIANALVKRGLIVRNPSEEDRRRVLIHITPAGRRFVRQVLPSMFPRVRAAFAGFTASESRTLSQLLRKLALNLDQMDPDAQP